MIETEMVETANFQCSQSTKGDIGDKLNGNSKAFCLVLHLSQFKPSDISVSISERVCIIEASHEEYCDEHGFVTRDFMRKEALPIGVDVDSLVCHFTREGLLIVQELFDGFNRSLIDIKELSNLNSEVVNKIAIVDNPKWLTNRRLSIQLDDVNEINFGMDSSQNFKVNGGLSLTNGILNRSNLDFEEYSELDDMAHDEVDLKSNKSKFTEVKKTKTECLKDSESQVEYEIYYVGTAKSKSDEKPELNNFKSDDIDIVCAEKEHKRDEKDKTCDRKNEVMLLTHNLYDNAKVREMCENGKVCKFGHAAFIVNANICDDECNVGRKKRNDHVIVEQLIEPKQSCEEKNKLGGEIENVGEDERNIADDKKCHNSAELEGHENSHIHTIANQTKQNNGGDVEKDESSIMLVDVRSVVNREVCDGYVNDDKDVLENTYENMRNNQILKERNDNKTVTLEEKRNEKQELNKTMRSQVRQEEKVDENQQISVDYSDRTELKKDEKTEVKSSKNVTIEINIDQEATENVIIDVTQNNATDKDDQSGSYEVHIDIENKGKKIPGRSPRLQKSISLKTNDVAVKEKVKASVLAQNPLRKETVKGKVRKVITRKESEELGKEEFTDQHKMEAKRVLRPSSKQENIGKDKNVTKRELTTKKESVLTKNASISGKRELPVNKKGLSANKTEAAAGEKKRTNNKESLRKKNSVSDEKDSNTNEKEDPSRITKATSAKKEVALSKNAAIPPNKKEIASNKKEVVLSKKEMAPIKKRTTSNKK